MIRRCFYFIMVSFTLFGAIPAFAANLDNWNEPVAGLAQSDNFESVTYGNGKFVAVSQEHVPNLDYVSVAISSDGMSWHETSVLDFAAVTDVIYANGKFVMVNSSTGLYSGVIMTSSDGENWVPITVSALKGNSLYSITYGNGTYVAVGASGLILTSSDAVSWTVYTSGTNSLYSINYINGKFVAVGSVDTILTSSDGLNWTKRNPTGTTTNLFDVTYGNGIYVIVGNSGAIFTSSDLDSWTKRTSGVENFYIGDTLIETHLWNVAYGDSTFVAVGDRETILTSTDGSSWTIRRSSDFEYAKSYAGVAYGNGVFAVVGSGDGTGIPGHDDGVNHILVNAGTLAYISNLQTGGTVPEGKHLYAQGASVTVLGNTGGLVRPGVTFAGWNTAEDGSGISYAAGDTLTMGTANVTLYAQWTAIPPGTYTVTYIDSTNLAGHVPTDSQSYALGAQVTVLENLSSPIKTFAGWNTEADGSGTSYKAGDTFNMGTANVTLYAQWTANPTYTVTYNGNGNTEGTVPTDINSYERGQSVVVQGDDMLFPGMGSNFSRAGYTFTGWNTAPDGSGTSYAEWTSFDMGTANVTLYAQWKANTTYTVTYNGNGNTGGNVPTDNHSYGQNASVTASENTGSLVRTGYTFVGWNTAADGSGTSYAPNAGFTIATANVTLYAQWTANPTYIVTYSGNGSTGGSVPTDNHSYEQNASVTVSENTGSLVRTGYTFAGWNTTADGTGTSYTAGATFKMGAANVTMYAQWTKNPTYTITYDGNGNTEGVMPKDNQTYEQNATVTVSVYTENLARTGYAFTGWNTAADGSGVSYTAGATFKMGAANVTLYAQWTAVYTVTYDGNGSTEGTVPKDNQTYEQNTTVTVSGNTGKLTRTGYTFAGWNTAADGSGTNYAADATFKMGVANVTLYAQWMANPPEDSSEESPANPKPIDTTVISTDGTLTLPAGKTGEVSLQKEVTISIPTGATDKELKLTIEKVLNTQNLLKDKNVLASPIFEILKNFSENFKKPVTLTFAFDPTKIGVNQRVAVFYYDEAKKEWVEVPGGIVSGNHITVDVDHFTKYAVMVVGTSAAVVPTNPNVNFTDISGHWAEANIKQAVGDGIVKGYPDGTFKPNHTITRAEFAVMLMNALKSQGEGAALTFTDKAMIGSWAQKAVAQAVQAGIIKGDATGSFRPDAEITRAEMAVMISKALGQSVEANASTGLAGDHDIPAWAIDAVAFVLQAGIVQGIGDNEFAPQDQATRAEAVTVLLNMLAQKNK